MTLFKSPLVVEFDASDRECVQRRENDLQLRVRVTNRGKREITNVVLRLCEREPYGHDHLLRVRHDNTPPFTFSKTGASLIRGESCYFDVVYQELMRETVVFQYADEYLLSEQTVKFVPRAVHLFTLEAHGSLKGRSILRRRVRMRLDPVGVDDLSLTTWPDGE